MKEIVCVCNKKRKLVNSEKNAVPSDEEISRMAKFTDKFNLHTFRNFLHFVPRLVNVVTVSFASLSSIWMHRSNCALPALPAGLTNLSAQMI